MLEIRKLISYDVLKMQSILNSISYKPATEAKIEYSLQHAAKLKLYYRP